VVTNPGTLLDAASELARSGQQPVELARTLLEPARESRHLIPAIAGWMLRPQELQVIDKDQIKRAAAHCDLPGRQASS
jgi:hypothetical protein